MDCGSIDIPSSFPCNRDLGGQDGSDTAVLLTVLTVTEVPQAIRILDRLQILQFNSSFLVYFIFHTRPLLPGYPALCTVQIGDSLPT